MSLIANGDSHHGPSFSLRNRLSRWVWNVVRVLCFSWTPRPAHAWRRMVLILFGARVGRGSHIYPGARIWAPWNLVCGEVVSIADGAEIYNPARIALGNYAIISQGAYLCAASHDYTKIGFPLVAEEIRIGNRAWIAARAIVNMGITIGDGCVIGSGSVVTKDMPAWSVCAGNPCRVIREHYERN